MAPFPQGPGPPLSASTGAGQVAQALPALPPAVSAEVGFPALLPSALLEMRLLQERKLMSFCDSLPFDDLVVFLERRRLSVPAREAVLLSLDPVERKARGLRFSDEPTSSPTEEVMRMEEIWAAHPKPPFRVEHILVSLWHEVVPITLAGTTWSMSLHAARTCDIMAS